LQRVFELPDATVNVLQGTIFIAILFSDSLYGRRWRKPAQAVAA
jgi:simple sugar transport system permease protein